MITINEETKISDLIKANPATIDAIAEINHHFRKLKNPILRRTLAKRVSIQDAAKIGGVSVEFFMEKLINIGFKLTEDNFKKKEIKIINNMKTLSENDKIIDLDVRPNISAGNDPFKIIMLAIKELSEGETLRIINIFEPIPLINILREKGYDYEVTRPDPGIVHTYFKKRHQASATIERNINLDEYGDFQATKLRFKDKTKAIDVRELEMPEPMVNILSELEALPLNHALFVHHKKFPKFLIPELKNRGFEYVQQKIDNNNIDFIFFKNQNI